jgi:hypothetical protein
MVGRKLVEPALKRSKHLCTTFRPADAERIAAVCGAETRILIRYSEAGNVPSVSAFQS